MRRKEFAHDQGVITVTLWVALLPVKVIFGFTILFFCTEIRAPLLDPRLCTWAGQAAAAPHWGSGRNCPQASSLCQAPW